MACSKGWLPFPPSRYLLLCTLKAAVLVDVVDSYLPRAAVRQCRPSSAFTASSYNINNNVDFCDHVPALDARWTAAVAAAGKLRLMNDDEGAASTGASALMVMPTAAPGGRNTAFPPHLPRRRSTSSSGSGSGGGAICSGRGPLLSLDSHDGGDVGGGKGCSGGGNSHGGGNGDGNGGDGHEESPDEWFDDGRQHPLVLAGVGSGLGKALEGLKQAVRNIRIPWVRKDSSSREKQEGEEETAAASEGDLEQEMAKVLVADVVVEDSVVPRDVLASAAVKSGLLGREASAGRIQACATILNQWYRYEGYILSGVSNAVVSSNGTISFSVNEPVVSATEPVKLLFYKPANIKDPASELVRVEKGKTKAATITKGLGLKGGEHFRVDAERWKGVLGSGLFNGAQLAGAHKNSVDQGFTLDVNVEETRTVVFEPGVTKTLFDSNWAGEVCFEEKNLLGRNGMIGLDMRRSMASPFTSYSVRVGNNRFGQPGAWQVSFFRDSISPHSDFARGSGGGGYANSAIGPAASAPVFSTASPAGVPRDLGMLARSIKGAQEGSVSAAAVPADVDSKDVGRSSLGGNSTKEVVAASGGRGAAERSSTGGDLGLSRCHGVSLSTSWPFSFVRATAGLGYQKVSPPNNILRRHSSYGPNDGELHGGGVDEDGAGTGAESGKWGGGSSSFESNSDQGGALDVFTVSGGLSRNWRLPALLQRLGGGSSGPARGPGPVGGAPGETRAAGGQSTGSVSSFLDVKTGCLLDGSVEPRPFTQELATLVQRVPVGPWGKADSWNVTLNIKQQVQHCSKETPLYQVPPFGGQRTIRGFAEGELGRAKEYVLGTAEVRVPLRNLLGKLPAQGVIFMDLSVFRPITWSRAHSAPAREHQHLHEQRRTAWNAAGGGPTGGGMEGNPMGERDLELEQPPDGAVSAEGEDVASAVAGEEEKVSSAVVPSSAGGLAHEETSLGEWQPAAAAAAAASPRPVGGGFRTRRGQGVGLRLADLIQVDLGISRSGTRQLHIGLVDRNF